uniref:Lipocalin/cytosolic fatty-acid binding domain-containing protein n=1 Tax=Pseudictyota dubia TaxID=2749911 RepID=A0A7R9W5V6_9STRA|mmetsp:Transcript_33214/g.61170  ORF Transcript_33214/g.61170 Transcript_33214/m.61170 type:complete len:193 (+) Transcript_33214:128-706(+)
MCQKFLAAISLFLFFGMVGADNDVLWSSTEVILENQYPGEWRLERNTVPSFTTDCDRVEMAGGWKFLNKDDRESNERIKYGDEVLIENQYGENWYLERDTDPKFTSYESRIANNAAVWKIIPASEHGNDSILGDYVGLYDYILIQNQYGEKWYLQRHVVPKFTTPENEEERIANKAAVWMLLEQDSIYGGCA